jgi:hypothetical protein
VISGRGYCLGQVRVGILDLYLSLFVQTEIVPKDLPVRSSIFNGDVFLRLEWSVDKWGYRGVVSLVPLLSLGDMLALPLGWGPACI